MGKGIVILGTIFLVIGVFLAIWYPFSGGNLVCTCVEYDGYDCVDWLCEEIPPKNMWLLIGGIGGILFGITWMVFGIKSIQTEYRQSLELTEWFCQECGTKNSKDVTICRNCNNKKK
jgi:hypothetical protein